MASDNNRRTATGFTNINRVLGANVGNRLGQAVSGRIQQAGSDVQQKLNQAQQQFGQASQAGILDTEENKQAAGSTIGRILGTTTPDQMKILPGESEKFQNIRQGKYQGPTELENIQDIRSSAQNAYNFGNLGQTQTGRKELLSQTVGQPGYGYGKTKFDALLLGQQAGLNPVNTARRTTQGLVQSTEDANRQSQAQAQNLQSRAQQFKNDINAQIMKGLGGIDTSVDTAYTQAQAQEAARKQALEDLDYYATGKRTVTNPDGTTRVEYMGGGSNTPGELFLPYPSITRTQDLYNKMTDLGFDEATKKALFGSGDLENKYAKYAQDMGEFYNPSLQIRDYPKAISEADLLFELAREPRLMGALRGEQLLNPVLDPRGTELAPMIANLAKKYNFDDPNTMENKFLKMEPLERQKYLQQTVQDYITQKDLEDTGAFGKSFIGKTPFGNLDTNVNDFLTKMNQLAQTQSTAATGLEKPENVINPVEYERYKALNQLLGTSGQATPADRVYTEPKYKAGKNVIPLDKMV